MPDILKKEKLCLQLEEFWSTIQMINTAPKEKELLRLQVHKLIIIMRTQKLMSIYLSLILRGVW